MIQLRLLGCIDKGGLSDERLTRVVQLVLDVWLLDLLKQGFGLSVVLIILYSLKLILLTDHCHLLLAEPNSHHILPMLRLRTALVLTHPLGFKSLHVDGLVLEDVARSDCTACAEKLQGALLLRL